MNLTLATPALLFPAISLLLLAYTNRFLGIASVIRALHSAYVQKMDPLVLAQIRHLRRRIRLIRDMQLCGVLSILLCTVSMFLVARGLTDAADIAFVSAILLMTVSLILSLIEVFISTGTLDLHLCELERLGQPSPQGPQGNQPNP